MVQHLYVAKETNMQKGIQFQTGLFYFLEHC